MSRQIAKGAEACLYLEDWYGFEVIRKHRIPKSYRIELLDQALRGERTIHEARLLNAARRAGVHTPIVFDVDPEESTIIMEFIAGERLKELLPKVTPSLRRRYFRQIGEAVAHLHQHRICHGDLTTSNLILHASRKIYFIDFGLATNTQSLEDFGTDVHLLRRALLSTHYAHWKECFRAFMSGYQTAYGEGAGEVFRKVRAIESRGRYQTERIR
jgi:TP53 regulating kinase-like protein